MSGHLYCPAEDGACFVAREEECPAFEADRRENQIEAVEVSRVDVELLEALSTAAIRSGDTSLAIQGFALTLRLRAATDFWIERREHDRRAVT